MTPTKQTRATEKALRAAWVFYDPNDLRLGIRVNDEPWLHNITQYVDVLANIIDSATGLPALLAERNQLREACNSALIALEHPERATWRQTALTYLRTIANQETKA